MNVRYGTMDDAALLAALGAKTFYDTFAKDNTPENIDSYLRKSFSRDIQIQELSDPNIIFLIAESAGIPVGYTQLLLNSSDESIKGYKPLEIRRIYTSRDYLGTGVGKSLMQAVIYEAKQRGFDSIWLGVWEKNRRAIDFYTQWGFRQVGSHEFFLGDDRQTDFVMELGLT